MPSDADFRRWASDHCRWVEEVMKQVRTVQVGTTRRDLMKVFTEEGGISGTTYQSFICRECRYFRVDVQFQPYSGADRVMEWQGESGERYLYDPRDMVSKISHTYLGYPNWD